MKAVVDDALPTALVEVDARDRIVDVSPLLCEWTGLSAVELVGRQFSEVAHRPEGLDDAGSEYLPDVAEITLASGEILPVLVAEGPELADGHRYLSLFDARAQREFREKLQRRHALIERTQKRLELVIAASISFSEASSSKDLARILADTTAEAYAAEEAVVFLLDDRQVFTQVAGTNPFSGLSDAEALAGRARELRSVVKISGIDEARSVSPAVAAAFENSGVQSMIIAPIHQGSETLGILAAFFHHPRQFDEQASPLADALAGQAARAITALRLQDRLEHAAMHDDTTGLPNRRLLEERMDGVRRTVNTVLAVLFVDLDGFKNVNDQLGHQIGDAVLREVASRLAVTVREDDIVARYGGNEFIVVSEVVNQAAALEIAERVRESIGAPYDMLPEALPLGASIGVSVTSVDATGITTDMLVRAADQAMYRAKYAGGNRVVAAAG